MKTSRFAVLAPLSLLGLSVAAASVPPQSTRVPLVSNDLDRSEAPRALRADVDGDGEVDFLFVHPSGATALFRRGEHGLEERVGAFGPEGLPAVRSASFGDANGDGMLDLLVVAQHGAVLLFQGDGRGAFRESTLESGLVVEGFALDGRFEDLDQDGSEDLIVSMSDGFVVAHNIGGVFEMETLALNVPLAPLGVVALAPSSGAGAPTGAAPGADDVARRASSDNTRTPLGTNATTPTSSSVPPTPVHPIPGSAQPLTSPLALLCAKTIENTSTQRGAPACLEASTAPTIGKLYPQSVFFNIASTGKIAVNHTSPTAQIDIRTTNSRAFNASTTGDESAATLRTSSATWPALWASGNNGAASGLAGRFEGRVEVGYTLTSPFPINVPRVFLDADPLLAGRIRLNNRLGHETVGIRGSEFTDNGAEIVLAKNDGTQTIFLDAENGAGGTFGAEFSMRTGTGIETVEIKSQEAVGNGAQIALAKANGIDTIVLDAETGSGCEISLRNSVGTETIEMITEEVSGNGAQIVLRKYDGSIGIILDAEQGGTGRVTTEVLQITGGSDLVEGFHTGDSVCAPGSVVVIDPNAPGQLMPSSTPYDARVAGVVSGAGGVRPGLTMGQAGVLDGDTNVALTGRVFVRCTAENGAIRPGDLLTTSSTAGAAMRADDPTRSFGAVIGKSMGALESGEGLVLVLVNLQ